MTAHQHVRKPDPRRGHPDADLVGTGLRRVERDLVQDLDRLPLVLYLPGPHQRPLGPAGSAPR